MAQFYKVVKVDNYDRENIVQRAVAQFIPNRPLADAMCEALQTHPKRFDEDWYVVKEQSYVLWRGMADLIGEPDPIIDPFMA